MKFGVDTYSWSKLILLRQTKWKYIIEEILGFQSLFITLPVLEELKHFFHQHEEEWSRVQILETKQTSVTFYNPETFDEADISLLRYAEEEDFTIITEDRPMLLLNIHTRNNIISLADFFALLYKIEYLTRKEFYQLLKWFEAKKNITKQKTKKLKELLK